MSGQRQEDGFIGHTDTLEEVPCHHLETDYREKQDYDAEAFGRSVDESFVGGKERYGYFWDEFAYQKSKGGHGRCAPNGELQYFVDTIILLGTIIVTGNRLHPLSNPHDNHYADKYQSVYDTVCANGQVAVVFLQSLIDENHNEARGHVHAERSEADSDDILNDFAL